MTASDTVTLKANGANGEVWIGSFHFAFNAHAGDIFIIKEDGSALGLMQRTTGTIVARKRRLADRLSRSEVLAINGELIPLDDIGTNGRPGVLYIRTNHEEIDAADDTVKLHSEKGMGELQIGTFRLYFNVHAGEVMIIYPDESALGLMERDAGTIVLKKRHFDDLMHQSWFLNTSGDFVHGDIADTSGCPKTLHI
jgi:hypothetical protein